MVAGDVAWRSSIVRRHLGSIRGPEHAAGVVGDSLGPIPLGLSYDYPGGYTPANAGLLTLPVLAPTAVSQVGAT